MSPLLLVAVNFFQSELRLFAISLLGGTLTIGERFVNVPGPVAGRISLYRYQTNHNRQAGQGIRRQVFSLVTLVMG